MISTLRPRTWWQAGLLWGTAMLVFYMVRQAFEGRLTLGRAGADVVIWEVGGLLFGVLLTGALSLFAHKDYFRGGFPDRKGDGR
jgi:hypothetical protein